MAMLQRPKKKELSAEERQAITQASAKQTGELSSPKTYDSNFPLFDTPVNQKVLIYIPNHVVTMEDGSVQLRKDAFAAHDVRLGKAYQSIRCSGDVVNNALGLDGSCPVCNAMSECWDLFNMQFSELAKSRGLDPEAPETKEALKEDMKKLLDERAIKKADKWFTFPIVVIDCEDGKTTPKRDAEGKISGTPMFYSVRETTYLDKWESAFDALDDDEGSEDKNPAGRWAILNFTYTPKSGTHNKRDSARNLKVTFKSMPAEYNAWEKYFNELTEEWTPEKAQDVLVRNAIRNMEEMEVATEEVMKATRDALAIYNLKKTGGNASVPALEDSSAENALAGFGATQVTETPVQPAQPITGEMPNIGVQ